MAKSVVVGIDLGASDSYVAYVGKGIVDIVQNEVSKRATPSIVGFTERERLLGDAALSLIRSNAKNTCRNFKHLLGRRWDAPDLETEHFWSTSKLCESDDGHAGYEVMYKGETRKISAVEVAAMYFTKLREITEKWCEGKLVECVISVPSAYSDVQRQAVLDAAKVANLKVLRVMNEHTATALAYGIYRSNDFDPEKPMTVAFCSMGNSIFSVSIVQFIRGKLSVVCEKSDKVGGRELDECLMREFGTQFKKKVGCDPLSNKKAAYKLEDAVVKTKKILSANSEAGITCECLMEDEDFASQITREDLEKMCEPAMAKVRAVLDSALAASGMKTEEIDSVEIVGGGSRVPWVKRICSEVFGGKDLSTTMNQEESVARGCALQAAILSPLYKVRDFKVEDTSPFGINIGWMGSAPPPADGGAKEEDGDASMGVDVEGEWKTSTVFPAGSPMNLLKTLTFYRKGPFEIKAEFVDDKSLLPKTPKELGAFYIEVPPQTEAKKVKVRTKLTLHGTFLVEGAQLVEEEEYEEVTKEKRELPPEADVEVAEDAAVSAKDAAVEVGQPQEGASDPDPAGARATTENAEEGDAKKEGEAREGNCGEERAGDEDKSEEKPSEKGEKKKEPRYEWVEVKKLRKRTRKTDLKVTSSGTPGLSADTIQKLMDAESAMQADMREIIETDEKRNDLEAYILSMRAKISEGAEYGDFISAAERDVFASELTKAEDWLYDNPDGTKTMFIDKMDELRKKGEQVAWICKEAGMRAEWVQAVTGTITNYRKAADTPGEEFGHIPEEKLRSIAAACNDLEAWLKDMTAKQDKLAKHEMPILICAEMERRNKDLAKMADEILKEPKPSAPPRGESPEDESPSKEERNGNSPGEGQQEDGQARQDSKSEQKQDEQVKNGDTADMEVD